MNQKTLKVVNNNFQTKNDLKKTIVSQILFDLEITETKNEKSLDELSNLEIKVDSTRIYNQTKSILYSELVEDQVSIDDLLSLKKSYSSQYTRDAIFNNRQFLKPVAIRILEIYSFSKEKEKDKINFKSNIESILVHDFPINCVESSKLKELRKHDNFFAMCFNSNYYYCDFPQRFSLLGSDLLFDGHQCNNCYRQWAIPEIDGGCDKVRLSDLGIEDFPYITYGYETHNAFVVSECTHYLSKVGKPRMNFDLETIRKIRKHLSLEALQ